MSEKAYQPDPGTEDYVHILVSEKQGQSIAPKVELYHPANVGGVMGLQGFKGEIKHDPRTAAQKRQAAPAADTVKAPALDGPESYRARYAQLFREAAPFNLSSDELRVVVDRAESKLAEFAKGSPPAAEAENAAFKAPTDKAGWLALYRAAHPDDATEDKDLTVAYLREKLGK